MGITLDNGMKLYNPDECIVLYHKMIDVINIFIEKGSFGDFNFLLMGAHHGLAIFYAQKNDTAAALNHLKLAAEHAVMYDAMPNFDDNLTEEYTSILFRGVKFPFNVVHCPFTMTENLLEESYKFDSSLPIAELEEIRNELRKHIKTNQ